MPSVTSPVFLQFRTYYGTATNRRFGPCMDGARVARSNLTFLRSVRVQPCIRPIFAWRVTSVAMRPQWPLALM